MYGTRLVMRYMYIVVYSVIVVRVGERAARLGGSFVGRGRMRQWVSPWFVGGGVDEGRF